MTDFLSTRHSRTSTSSWPRPSATSPRRVVAPVAARHDAEHSFPYEVVAGMADMGLFGLPFPEEWGGMGGDYFALCLALEELGKVDQSVAITLEAGVSLGAMPVYRFGTDAQKRGMAAAAGQWPCPGCVRADRAGRRHRCRRDEDHRRVSTTAQWVINGSKQFITNSGTDITKLVTVTAVTGERDGKKEISSILVPVPTRGFTVEPAYDKVGWNASDTHPLSFDDVRVPEENLLGERGRGYANFLRILDEGRIAIAALSIGAAQGCVDESVTYAREREAFGQRDRPLPVDRVHHRADGGPRPHRAHRLLRRRGADAGREAVQEAGGDRQAGRQRGGHGQRPRRHPDSRRLRVYE